MRRPFLRWLAPLGIAATVLGTTVGADALGGAAEADLPPRSAAELLVDLQTAQLQGLSGTVVTTADLGLPALPGRAGHSGSTRLESLLNGSHTLRVWYSEPDKARLALLGTFGESDVIRNGRDVWVWSSDEQAATHWTLPERADERPGAAPGRRSAHGLLPATPQEAAERVLAALDPSTVVTTAGTARVAGRAAYELVLAPREAASLVREVRLAVDGEQRVPLRVQVFAKGSASPAFEVGFRQVDFTRPGDEHFRFTPPPGTRVEEAAPGQRPDLRQLPGTGAHERLGTPERRYYPYVPSEPQTAEAAPVRVVGSGWTSVLVARLPGLGEGIALREDGHPLRAYLATLPRVSGDWGSGRLLRSRLLTVLVTDDGRVLAGAVTPQRLYAVAADA